MTRFSTLARRGIGSLLPTGRLRRLGAVLRPTLLPVRHAGRVERAPYDVVPHTRQILDAAAPDQHHRVLLQVVPLARYVGGHLHTVGQPDTGDLPQRRV